MKNNFYKFLIKIFLIVLFFTNVHATEQFNFKITQIEITDDGNKYIGSKRGTITSDNGLIIEADNFEYKKIENILNAYGDVKINDTINNYLIFSEDITYIKNEEKLFSKGPTRAIIESKYNFTSSDVTLLRLKKELYSSKLTEVKDDRKSKYLLNEFVYYINSGILKGNDIELISDYTKASEDRDLYTFKDGFFNLKTKNFQTTDTKIFLEKNVFGESENDPRLYGISSIKNNNITTINKGIFTSCNSNEKCPPWSIKAEKIDHNKIKKQLIYKNAFLNIYNVPILYFPKFYHPDPTVKRQSGFLTPQLNNSDILGTSLILPYYHVISDNKDLTFTPTLFNSNTKMFQSEFRKKNKFSSLITDFAHVTDFKTNYSNEENSISHLFAKYELNLNRPKFTKSLLNFNFEKVTNDTYLKLFDTNLIDKNLKPLDQDKLYSNLNVILKNDKYNLTTGISAYETLNGKNSDRYQYILPYYNYSQTLYSNKLGNFNFTSNGYNDLKETNILRTTQTNDLNFLSSDLITKNGLKNNFGIYFKNINTLGKNYINYKNSPQSEIESIYNFTSSYPLVKSNNSEINYLTPKFSLRFNPGDMKNYSNSKRLINTNNIFSIDRLSVGGDSFEKGKSLTVGFDYNKENLDNINKYFSLSLASVFRDKVENNIPVSSSIANKNSNIVGSTSYSPSKYYKLNYEFSLDNNFKNFEYNNIGTTFDYNNFITTFNFLEESGKIGSSNSIENITKLKFDESKYISFNTRRNRKTSFTEYYDLVYEYQNDCLTASIKYKKTFYQDRELTPNEDLIFSISLFPLTTFEQKVDQSFYRNN